MTTYQINKYFFYDGESEEIEIANNVSPDKVMEIIGASNQNTAKEIDCFFAKYGNEGLERGKCGVRYEIYAINF